MVKVYIHAKYFILEFIFHKNSNIIAHKYLDKKIYNSKFSLAYVDFRSLVSL